MEAFGISSLFIVGNGIITDIYPPSERGYAMGIFGIPPLVGPIIGPIIGGAVAGSLGWRSTFIVLTILGFLFFLLMFLLPETLPHHVFTTTVSKKLPNAKNPFPTPIFLAPWKPLLFWRHPGILTVTISSGLAFCCLYILLIVFPIVLADAYQFSELIIGICFLPFGAGAMVGSLIGGRVTDKLAIKYKCPEGGLIATIIGLLIMIPGLLVSGWILQYPKGNLPTLLIFNAFSGFGVTWAMPGVFSYAIMQKPMFAAAITGSLQSGEFILCAIAIFAGAALSQILGNGILFTGMAVLLFLSIIPLAFITRNGIRKAAAMAAPTPKDAELVEVAAK